MSEFLADLIVAITAALFASILALLGAWFAFRWKQKDDLVSKRREYILGVVSELIAASGDALIAGHRNPEKYYEAHLEVLPRINTLVRIISIVAPEPLARAALELSKISLARANTLMPPNDITDKETQKAYLEMNGELEECQAHLALLAREHLGYIEVSKKVLMK